MRIQDDSVWLTKEGLSQLFDKGRTTITEHLKHIFEEGELDAIIFVGYRVNSQRATQFQTDIYSTAVDYSKDAKTTKDFFATVQNKLFAMHGHTAAEVIV